MEANSSESVPAPKAKKSKKPKAKVPSPVPPTPGRDICDLTFEEFLELVCKLDISPGQRTLVRVCFDDVEPKDLPPKLRKLALDLFGPVDTIPPTARYQIAWYKGARIGGTLIGSYWLLYAAFKADLSTLRPGEMGRAAIVAPTIEAANQALDYVTGIIDETPILLARVHKMNNGGKSGNSVVLKRPDGRLVKIWTAAATRGGTNLRGKSYVSALFDEVSFFRSDGGAVNDTDLWRSVNPRLLPGCKILAFSTAYLESGLLWDMKNDNFGDPKFAVVAIAKTLTVLPTERNKIIVAQERLRDPANAAREFDCVPLDNGMSTFFDKAAVDQCAVEGLPLIISRTLGNRRVLCIDAGFTNDATGACILEKDSLGKITCCQTFEVKPGSKPGTRLKPSVILASIITPAKEAGCTHLICDIHYIETVREHAQGLIIIEAPGGNTGKSEVYTAAQTAVHEGRVVIPALQRGLIQQLKEIVGKPLAGGGIQLSSPRSKGSHGDVASAFVLGLWHFRPVPTGYFTPIIARRRLRRFV